MLHKQPSLYGESESFTCNLLFSGNVETSTEVGQHTHTTCYVNIDSPFLYTKFLKVPYAVCCYVTISTYMTSSPIYCMLIPSTFAFYDDPAVFLCQLI